MSRVRCVIVVASALLCAMPATARAVTYAPLDRPGPPLSVPRAQLAASLLCHGNPRVGPEPVLLNPATGVTPDENYSWNYERAFNAQGRAWCAVTVPFHTLGDIQTAAEYLVNAIRTMHARAGRRIAVAGHSQGGMSMRWPLRFWPDTRSMIDDVVGWAGTNHGTTGARALHCESNGCVPASWQQGADANFIKALNSFTETFGGISYTEVYTRFDEVATPNSDDNGTSSLHIGRGRITNSATQDICPLDTYEHNEIGTIDPTAYALAIDALDHGGPASKTRVGTASCSQTVQPGVDPANVQNFLKPLQAVPGLLGVAAPANVVGAPVVKSEPPLRCYVFASCPAGATAATTCVSASGRNRGLSLGPVRLGRTTRQARRALGGVRLRGRRRLDRWCLNGGGVLALGYRRGKATVAITTGRKLTVGRVRRGSSVRTLRRRVHGLRRVRAHGASWLVSRRSRLTMLFKLHGRKVTAVGVGARRLTVGRRAQRRFLAAWRL